MNKFLMLALLPLLGACSTPPAPVAPLVVESVEVKRPDVPEVSPPQKPAIPKFSFQEPSNPTSIVAMDANNYSAFREVMLLANKRELEWNSRLSTANKYIRLLKGTESSPKVTNKPLVLPIPRERPTDAGSNPSG